MNPMHPPMAAPMHPPMAAAVGSHLRSRFMASPQARAALAISVLYVISTGILRPTPLNVAVSVIKMLSIVYTVNCMVSGGCGLMGWTNVLGLAMFWLADVLTLVNEAHTKRHRAPRWDDGVRAPVIRNGIRASS